jgi:radical SAM superfamily enzyme YgiQ (UPF0313 family)
MQFDDEKAYLLRQAGCYAMRIGVQTLTERIRKKMGRPENSDIVSQAISAAKKANLRVEIDHMVNIPGETLEEARRAVNFYNQNRPDAIKVYWLTPLPGSLWFEKAKCEGLLSPEEENLMRQGRGYGEHSYLFMKKGRADSCWIGIHLLLAYLPILPFFLMRILVRIRADRFLRIPSFLVAVGIPRAFQIIKGWDRVGEGHLKKKLAGLTLWAFGSLVRKVD